MEKEAADVGNQRTVELRRDDASEAFIDFAQ